MEKKNIEISLNSNDKLNTSNISSLQLNIQPTSSVIESLNLIDIKNKKLNQKKFKLNLLNKPNNKPEQQLNTITSQEGNYKIKYHQKIIFVPSIVIFIFIEFFLRINYLVNIIKEMDSIEKKYYKFLLFIHICFIYICYFLCVYSDPSQTNITKKYLLTDEKFQKLDNKINIDSWSDYCNYCQTYKFIRSSHCNYCNKCVLLKFNHFFLIANCIGFNNVQYVINFLILIIVWLYEFENSCLRYFNTAKSISFVIIIFFALNIPILLYFLYIFLTLMFDVYNNQTKYERKNTKNLLDKYYPIYKCNDTDNKFRFPNVFNIGYLSHFYYLIGNTFLHFFLPIPKIKNYELDELCPIFKGSKQFNKIEFVQCMMKKDESYKKSIENRYMDPDKFIAFCRQKNNQK